MRRRKNEMLLIILVLVIVLIVISISTTLYYTHVKQTDFIGTIATAGIVATFIVVTYLFHMFISK